MADTLCLSCAKCYGDCPWSERDPETKRIKFQSVPGWTAEPTWKRGCGASYHVVACPLYVSDGKDYSAGRGQKPKYDVRAVSDCLRAGMTDKGRCVVLPCMIGDTVYVLNHHLGRVFENEVAGFSVGYQSDNRNSVSTVYVGKYGSKTFRRWKFQQFGKTVFLTREEAEAALKEAEE